MPENETHIYWSHPGSRELLALKEGEGNDRFYFAPFDPEGEPIVLEGKVVESQWDELSLTKPSAKMPDTGTLAQDHRTWVKSAIQFIADSDLDKVVLSTINPTPGSIEVSESLKALRECYPQAMVYVFHHPDTGMWMGASPEPLINSSEGRYMTASLAGTRLYEEVPVPWGQKESLEQSIVTDYIKSKLRESGATELRISRPETIRFGDIEHIRSEIRFGSDDLDKTIRHLHPTPAVCGTPLNTAIKFIQEHEKHPRKWYTGYFGVIRENTDAQLFVNLRCCEVFSDGILVYAGGGITFESEPEHEWEETRAKAASIAQVMIK